MTAAVHHFLAAHRLANNLSNQENITRHCVGTDTCIHNLKTHLNTHAGIMKVLGMYEKYEQEHSQCTQTAEQSGKKKRARDATSTDEDEAEDAKRQTPETTRRQPLPNVTLRDPHDEARVCDRASRQLFASASICAGSVAAGQGCQASVADARCQLGGSSKVTTARGSSGVLTMAKRVMHGDATDTDYCGKGEEEDVDRGCEDLRDSAKALVAHGNARLRGEAGG
jgi:hypothetical protein